MTKRGHKVQCAWCGRTFVKECHHRCNIGFRKRKHKWIKLKGVKQRKSYIFTIPEEPSDAYVAFGGGIGMKAYTHILEFTDESVEFEDLCLSTLESEYAPQTELSAFSEQSKDMPNTPRIHLLFNNVASVDAMIEVLQSVRKSLTNKH